MLIISVCCLDKHRPFSLSIVNCNFNTRPRSFAALFYLREQPFVFMGMCGATIEWFFCRICLQSRNKYPSILLLKGWNITLLLRNQGFQESNPRKYCFIFRLFTNRREFFETRNNLISRVVLALWVISFLCRKRNETRQSLYRILPSSWWSKLCIARITIRKYSCSNIYTAIFCYRYHSTNQSSSRNFFTWDLLTLSLVEISIRELVWMPSFSLLLGRDTKCIQFLLSNVLASASILPHICQAPLNSWRLFPTSDNFASIHKDCS